MFQLASKVSTVAILRNSPSRFLPLQSDSVCNSCVLERFKLIRVALVKPQPARDTAAGGYRTMATAASPDTGAVAVYVTVPDKEVGKKLASGLVEAKMAACVNIIPGVESVYWWEGKVNSDHELILMIKTRSALVPEVTKWVKANHPYDECEVISVAITGGSSSYIKWILDSTKE